MNGTKSEYQQGCEFADRVYAVWTADGKSEAPSEIWQILDLDYPLYGLSQAAQRAAVVRWGDLKRAERRGE